MNERHIWWGAMAVVALLHMASLALDISVYTLPVLVALSLLFFFERGEKGAFPFKRRHVVQYSMNYFGFVVLLAVIFNTAPRALPSGEVLIQPLVWALPMIGLYLAGLYFRRTG